MDVVIWIIGRVVLDDPVNFWEIKTSLSNIGAKQDTSLCLAELKISACSLLLFLLAVDVLHSNIDVVEKVRVEFDGIT